MRIAAALRAREPEAFRLLYDEYAAPLHAYCWFMVGDEATRAVRDTFIAASRNVATLRDDSLTVWVYALARAECVRRRALDVTAHLWRNQTVLTDPLDRAISRLRPDHREVLALSAAGRLQPEDIARVLGVATDTAEQMVRVARNRLETAVITLLAAGTVRPEDSDVVNALGQGTLEQLLSRRRLPRPPEGLRETVLSACTAANLQPGSTLLFGPDGLPIPLDALFDPRTDPITQPIPAITAEILKTQQPATESTPAHVSEPAAARAEPLAAWAAEHQDGSPAEPATERPTEPGREHPAEPQPARTLAPVPIVGATATWAPEPAPALPPALAAPTAAEEQPATRRASSRAAKNSRRRRAAVAESLGIAACVAVAVGALAVWPTTTGSRKGETLSVMVPTPQESPTPVVVTPEHQSSSPPSERPAKTPEVVAPAPPHAQPPAPPATQPPGPTPPPSSPPQPTPPPGTPPPSQTPTPPDPSPQPPDPSPQPPEPTPPPTEPTPPPDTTPPPSEPTPPPAEPTPPPEPPHQPTMAPPQQPPAPPPQWPMPPQPSQAAPPQVDQPPAR